MKKFIKKGLFAALSVLLVSLWSCTAPWGAGIASEAETGDFFQEYGRAVGTVPFGEGSTIYQIMVDRFYDGDTANNGPTTDGAWGKATNVANQAVESGDKWHWKYRLMAGGDWKGITQKMNYIKGMGFKAIWISPTAEPQLWSPKFTDNGATVTLPSAYHGYNAKDPTKYNPYFGTKQDLIDLVNAAHSAGIAVIVDVVPNHVGDFLPGGSGTYTQNHFDPNFTTTYQPSSPWNNPSWYNQYGDIDWNKTFPTLDDRINYMQNHDLAGLDDFNFDNTTAKNAIFNAIKTVLTDIGADGMRVDAAKMMRPHHIRELEVLTGLKSFGENFDSDPAYVGRYVSQASNGNNAEWGMLDFPLYDGIINTFAWEGTFTADGSVAKKLESDGYYGGNENRMVTFLDSHDRNRFLSYTMGNVNKLHLGLIFLFTARGVPVVFQGTEQNRGNDGGAMISGGIADTYNRWAMFGHDASGNTISNSFVTTTDTYQLIKKLNGFKDLYPSLRMGKQREMWRADKLFAYSRRVDAGTYLGDESITIFNTGTTSASWNLPLRAESTLAVGTVLYNAFDATKADKVTVTAGGATGRQITITVGAGVAKIYTLAASNPVAPEAPTGVAAVPASTTSITVSWNASAGATGYEVYKSTSATTGFTSAGTTTGTSLTAASLTVGTKYYFYVKASNSSGTSPASTTVNATLSLYTSVYPTMNLRGSLNTWGNTPMVLTANNTWTVSASLSAGMVVTYKYDAYGNWATGTNWGDTTGDGIADAGGNNISYTPGSTGTYVFSFNDATRAYSVTPGSTSVAAPTFNPAAGGVTIGTVVTISTATSGATVYYTTNGTTPTTSSPSGTAGSSSAQVTVNAGMTIKALAVKTGYTNSAVASATYTITTKVPGQLTITLKTGASSENVSFPGDANNWSLTAHQISTGANTTKSVVIANGVTSTTIPRGSSTTALELKLVTAASWNNQWSFSTWTLGSGITLTDSGRQITLVCAAGDQVDLTIDVAARTLSYTKK